MNRSRPVAQVVYDMIDGFIEATQSLARQPLRRAPMRSADGPEPVGHAKSVVDRDGLLGLADPDGAEAHVVPAMSGATGCSWG